MRIPAKTLLAGTLAVTLPWAGAATSQSFQLNSVDNQQYQSGDVLADGRLDVVDMESADSNAHAMGNGYTAETQSGSLAVTSSQELQGNVAATNTVNVANYTGSLTMNTSATGNSGDANSLGFADLHATVDQHTGPYSITATSRLYGGDAQLDNPADSVQAIGNSHGFAVVGGSSDVTVTQSHEGLTQADGGTDAGYIPGSGTFSAAGISNNVSIVGTSGAEQAYAISQSMTGDRTQGAYFSTVGNGQEVTTTASAVANNISASNENNPIAVTAEQNNIGYVRAQADSSSYQFGAASVSGNGIGNSSVVGSNGADLNVDVAQANTGGVEVISSFAGNNGYDAYSSAVAMGNASTGYACSTCQAQLTVKNRQSNTDGVEATSNVTISASNRHVSSVATAVGNSATYYLSTPNN